MKINCRLIVSDFDGTLIDDYQRILPEVKEAIEEYTAAGGIFAVCTGRMLSAILPHMRSLGLKGPVIAYQGSTIADIESGKIIKKGGINYCDVAEICRTIEKLGFNQNIYSDETIFSSYDPNDIYLTKYEDIVGVTAKHVDGKMSEFVEKHKLICQKVLCIVPESDRMTLYGALKSALGDKFDVTCSAKVLVEVSPLGDNKGEALKYLAHYYNIPIEKTVAAGDNLNDLSMILAAGIGCAVGNAEKELKDVADFVSVSNNDGALAQIIRKFGFA